MGDISEHFFRHEFQCKGKACINGMNCGFDTVDTELLGVLEDVREHFKSPVTINSACRCEVHNKAVSGRPDSKHRLGIAADITVRDVKPYTVCLYLETQYPHSHGIGSYNDFTHVDVRKEKARW